ncbi:hypothetical protein BCR32DRAFT_282221 [Anaeromyces robustus]|uniref:TFIIS-type domain-containing protein n=1 Tax=Anaeromyces robustus TaxID=1754192 RepID=A0A1Y1WYK2_9FUNG|nr:hypothetical protein BCR32DRAFT_282221 [Anaeromyces robustus]|eukprot:ORX78475.1 hypothetical protein BCR32DRAFT_282221 [Anaeromyces robustus]
MDNNSLDKFFEESPLFKEERLSEKKKLNLIDDKVINSMSMDGALRCKRCNNNNIVMKRLQIRRSDEAGHLVYYCLNCIGVTFIVKINWFNIV